MSHNHTHIHQQNATHNIGVAFFLNLSFTIIELFGGLYTNSMAILSDAIHDFGDSVAIGLSWYLEKVSHRKASIKFSYGYRRFSLVGAMLNAFLLIAGSSIVIYSCIGRLMHPEAVSAAGMFWLAILGVLVNGAAVIKTSRGSGVNEKLISLHMLEDVLGWVAVLVVSVVMLFVDVPVLDPILSIGISIYVLYNVINQLMHTFNVLLQGVPVTINVPALRNELQALPSVVEVHDLHIWSLDSEYNIGSLHVVVGDTTLSCQEQHNLKCQVKGVLQQYGIAHATVELECQGEECQRCDL